MTSQPFLAPTPTQPAAAPRYEHPSLALLVNEAQRDRAISYLQGAYADGRIAESEFDARVGRAIEARTRGELNEAFTGLVHIPVTSQALGVHPAYQPVLNQNSDGTTGRAAAAIAHWSGMFTMIFGPAFMYAVSAKGSYANREAAKAFNFQLTMLLSFIIGGVILGDTFLSGIIMPILGVSWFVLTLISGARASKGENWNNPVNKFVPLKALNPGKTR